jgi:hypothetical protein
LQNLKDIFQPKIVIHTGICGAKHFKQNSTLISNMHTVFDLIADFLRNIKLLNFQLQKKLTISKNSNNFPLMFIFSLKYRKTLLSRLIFLKHVFRFETIPLFFAIIAGSKTPLTCFFKTIWLCNLVFSHKNIYSYTFERLDFQLVRSN